MQSHAGSRLLKPRTGQVSGLGFREANLETCAGRVLLHSPACGIEWNNMGNEGNYHLGLRGNNGESDGAITWELALNSEWWLRA